jgi:tRNA (guanine10-N2)-dimethyltransferase
VGSDFSEKMIEGAGRNLAHLKAEAELHLCDIGEIRTEVGMVDGVATDPPYGRSTTTDGEEISDLYARSLESIAGVLRKGRKLAIVTPDVELITQARGFRMRERHMLWVHRSLTRNFCVLERV